MYITFGDRMANFLSLNYDTRYFIGHCGPHINNPSDSNMTPTPKFEKTNIGSLFIYCDLVQKCVRVGDVLTNMLGIVSIDKNIVNMSNPIHIYRPLVNNYFHSASIRITDQFGSELEFEKSSFSAIEVIIKKR